MNNDNYLVVEHYGDKVISRLLISRSYDNNSDEEWISKLSPSSCRFLPEIWIQINRYPNTYYPINWHKFVKPSYEAKFRRCSEMLPLSNTFFIHLPTNLLNHLLA